VAAPHSSHMSLRRGVGVAAWPRMKARRGRSFWEAQPFDGET